MIRVLSPWWETSQLVAVFTAPRLVHLPPLDICTRIINDADSHLGSYVLDAGGDQSDLPVANFSCCMGQETNLR